MQRILGSPAGFKGFSDGVLKEDSQISQRILDGFHVASLLAAANPQSDFNHPFLFGISLEKK